MTDSLNCVEVIFLKRRKLILYGLGGFAAVAGQRGRFAVSKRSEAILDIGLEAIAPPEDTPLFQFVAIGDVGTGSQKQYDVAKAMLRHWESSPFSTVLMTGDNIYEKGEIEKVSEAFEKPYADLLRHGVKFYASLGNHDFLTKEGEDEIAYPGYNMPARYYTFTQQPVQFFALDTNQFYLRDSRREPLWNEQLQWLRHELEESIAPLKVVFAHHPIYSSGHHGSDPNLAKDLSPILEDYGVQLYLNGHDHNYERTESIKGVTYITIGNGAKLRRIGRREDWSARAESRLGFTTLDVYLDRLMVKAIDKNSRVYDESVIMAI